jgi:hypothetical protein
MTRIFHQTFRETLLEVARENVQVLECKAHIAASLVRICPKHQDALHEIEIQARDQAFRILASIPNGQDARRARDKRPDREPVGVLNLAAD